MIRKLAAALNVYRRGHALVNPAAWKGAAIGAELAALIAALSGLAVAMGWMETEIDAQKALEIGLGIAAAVQVFSAHVHLGSSEKVGIGPPPAAQKPATGRGAAGRVRRASGAPGVRKPDARAGDAADASGRRTGREDLDRFGGG